MLIGDEQKPEKDSTPFQSEKDFPLIRSPIDIRLPPFDLTPPLSEEEVMKVPEYHSSLPKALEIAPSIRHEWTEPITYRRDNYAHFISEDCEPANTIFKLLIATDRVDPQELWEKRPRKGQILVTPLGKYKTYSIVIQKYHFDDTNWEDVRKGLLSFKDALTRDQCETCRMANSGDLLGTLSQSRMTELLSDMFLNGPPTITLCHGKIEVPPVEDRLQIIFENHDSLIGGHKGVTKTYRRIRERYTWPGLRNDVHNYIGNCRSCLENKLVRARTHEPMVISDTPLGVFDKVSKRRYW